MTNYEKILLEEHHGDGLFCVVMVLRFKPMQYICVINNIF